MKMKFKFAALAVVASVSSVSMAFNFDINTGVNMLKKVAENKALITGYTYDEERQIGRHLSGSILGASKLVDNADLQNYVNKVGLWVASQSDRPDIDWVFGVIDSESINAFAAPGGYVLITVGLYNELQTEAQLAAVLGHEIAHITENHHLNLIRKSMLVSEGGELAKDAAKGSGGIADGVIQNALGSGAEMMARGLDKDSEYTADNIGMGFAEKAGYTPIGMAEVAMTLANKPLDDSGMTLLFSTHPSPQDRLEILDIAMETDDILDSLDNPDLASRFSEHAVVAE